MEDQEKPRKRQRDRVDWTDPSCPSRSKLRSEEAPAAGGPAVPSTEEVEEFFEILRRMQVAMRYFDKKINVEGGRGGRLREALKIGQVKSEGMDEGEAGAAAEEKGHAFDLNSSPDQEITEEEPRGQSGR
ncbi:hypothetical protein MLD38_032831 [Melastoma candidum]|uniref:Uncharacterized protein n=1 Tax=Melastoma candidum TaxID=119954 RepID=A0ACB9M736_9MYRT|nr:hypothetical protein MLD38_032831 [Melastoma candidum]